jgi:hypothetical protein
MAGGGNRGLLGLGNGAEPGAFGRGHAAHGDRAGHVHGVAVEHPAEVDHHELSCRDAAVGGAVMRAGAIRARGDDGLERGTFEPGAVERQLDLPGDFALGSTLGHLREYTRGHFCQPSAGLA